MALASQWRANSPTPPRKCKAKDNAALPLHPARLAGCRRRMLAAGTVMWSSEWPHCVLTNCTCYPGAPTCHPARSGAPPEEGSGSGVRVPMGTMRYSRHSSWKSREPIKTCACTLPVARAAQDAGERAEPGHCGWAAGHRCSGGAEEKGRPFHAQGTQGPTHCSPTRSEASMCGQAHVSQRRPGCPLVSTQGLVQSRQSGRHAVRG